MTEKVQKNKIADILLDFYAEYHSNEINRPMIPFIYAGKILDSLQEEHVSEDLEEAARSYTNNIDNICGSIGEQTRDAFKAGAKWAERKNQKKYNYE